MNTPVIEMDRAEAERKLKAALSIRHRDSEEYAQQLARAYRYLAKGGRLISLAAAFRAGGQDEKGLPRLAIARADRKEVALCSGGGQRVRFCCEASASIWRALYPSLNRDVEMPVPVKYGIRYSLVPAVPPDVRPKVGQLKQWYTLFEVDQWYETPKHMRAPIDPYLLEHIGGDLYGIVAEWELTEIERLVLEGVISG